MGEMCNDGREHALGKSGSMEISPIPEPAKSALLKEEENTTTTKYTAWLTLAARPNPHS